MAGRLIASIIMDDRILRCNTTEGTEVFEVQLDFASIALACTVNEILVGGEDPNKICTFSFYGQLLQTFPATSPALVLAVYKSGLKFATGFDDGMVAIYAKHDDNWSMITQWQTCREPVEELVWLSNRVVCTALPHGMIYSWDTKSGELTFRIQSSGSDIYCLSPVSDDGRFIFCGNPSGKPIRHNVKDGSITKWEAHGCAVVCVCLNFSNNTVLTGSEDHYVSAFDMESLTEKWSHRFDDWPTSIVVVDEEVFVGVEDSFIVVLNANNGEFVRQFAVEHEGCVYLAAQMAGPPVSRFKFED